MCCVLLMICKTSLQYLAHEIVMQRSKALAGLYCLVSAALTSFLGYKSSKYSAYYCNQYLQPLVSGLDKFVFRITSDETLQVHSSPSCEHFRSTLYIPAFSITLLSCYNKMFMFLISITDTNWLILGLHCTSIASNRTPSCIQFSR